MLVEDEDFKYAGYARVEAAKVIEGDGVRFNDVEPGVIVHAVTRLGDDVSFLVSDRAAHVASVFADALKRPIEGMSADPMPAVRVLASTDPVWIRL
jgi:hypothetical protein